MSTLGQLKIAALTNIATPEHLILDVRSDYDALMHDVGRRSVGFDGVTLFGCAFIQGGRLQFTTAMPVKMMLEISEQHRASKGANAREVMDENNRPREPAHDARGQDRLPRAAARVRGRRCTAVTSSPARSSATA